MREMTYLNLAVVHCSKSEGAMSGEIEMGGIKMGGPEEAKSGEIERGHGSGVVRGRERGASICFSGG